MRFLFYWIFFLLCMVSHLQWYIYYFHSATHALAWAYSLPAISLDYIWHSNLTEYWFTHCVLYVNISLNSITYVTYISLTCSLLDLPVLIFLKLAWKLYEYPFLPFSKFLAVSCVNLCSKYEPKWCFQLILVTISIKIRSTNKRSIDSK